MNCLDRPISAVTVKRSLSRDAKPFNLKPSPVLFEKTKYASQATDSLRFLELLSFFKFSHENRTSEHSNEKVTDSLSYVSYTVNNLKNCEFQFDGYISSSPKDYLPAFCYSKNHPGVFIDGLFKDGFLNNGQYVYYNKNNRNFLVFTFQKNYYGSFVLTGSLEVVSILDDFKVQSEFFNYNSENQTLLQAKEHFLSFQRHEKSTTTEIQRKVILHKMGVFTEDTFEVDSTKKFPFPPNTLNEKREKNFSWKDYGTITAYFASSKILPNSVPACVALNVFGNVKIIPPKKYTYTEVDFAQLQISEIQKLHGILVIEFNNGSLFTGSMIEGSLQQEGSLTLSIKENSDDKDETHIQLLFTGKFSMENNQILGKELTCSQNQYGSLLSFSNFTFENGLLKNGEFNAKYSPQDPKYTNSGIKFFRSEISVFPQQGKSKITFLDGSYFEGEQIEYDSFERPQFKGVYHYKLNDGTKQEFKGLISIGKLAYPSKDIIIHFDTIYQQIDYGFISKVRVFNNVTKESILRIFTGEFKYVKKNKDKTLRSNIKDYYGRHDDNGLPHGKGAMEFDDGSEFYGTFDHGFPKLGIYTKDGIKKFISTDQMSTPDKRTSKNYNLVSILNVVERKFIFNIPSSWPQWKSTYHEIFNRIDFSDPFLIFTRDISTVLNNKEIYLFQYDNESKKGIIAFKNGLFSLTIKGVEFDIISGNMKSRKELSPNIIIKYRGFSYHFNEINCNIRNIKILGHCVIKKPGQKPDQEFWMEVNEEGQITKLSPSMSKVNLAPPKFIT